MSNIAIKVENLSKAYQLGEIGTGTISRDLERWIAKLRGKEDPFLKIGETNDRTTKGGSDVVWSLKDLDFEINQGDAVGIIGRNGAGKSTLLKLLSRVTAPTSGTIKVKGRIASLLEVGTGFHPELTGRENIYLNGAILGMRKREIDRKFDEIVDFSGVERYIDTPVKRYSSGMYVRLAFAVAAHLESEILIVDEVLAVGDAEFQKKCLGKMGDVSKGEGRTVLFVSHNMGSIKALCNRGLVLVKGRNEFGLKNIDLSVEEYLKSNMVEASTLWLGSLLSSDGILTLKKVLIYNPKDRDIITFSNTMQLNIELSFFINIKNKKKYRFVLSVFTADGVNILNHGVFINAFEQGEYSTIIRLPSHFLNKNSYCIFFRLDVPSDAVYISERQFIQFDISEIEFHSFGVIYGNEPGGYIHLPLEYETFNI